MKIYNPTDEAVAVNVKGVDYAIEAKGELTGVPAPHAEYWKVHIHQFLVVTPEDNDEDITLKSAKPEEKVEEEVEEEEAPSEEAVNLDGLKRSELDELAEAQGLDSASYKTVDDIKEAIKEVVNKQ